MLGNMTPSSYVTLAILFLTIVSYIATVLIQGPHLHYIWHDMMEFKEGTPRWVKYIGFIPLVMVLLTFASLFVTLSS